MKECQKRCKGWFENPVREIFGNPTHYCVYCGSALVDITARIYVPNYITQEIVRIGNEYQAALSRSSLLPHPKKVLEADLIYIRTLEAILTRYAELVLTQMSPK